MIRETPDTSSHTSQTIRPQLLAGHARTSSHTGYARTSSHTGYTRTSSHSPRKHSRQKPQINSPESSYSRSSRGYPMQPYEPQFPNREQNYTDNHEENYTDNHEENYTHEPHTRNAHSDMQIPYILKLMQKIQQDVDMLQLHLYVLDIINNDHHHVNHHLIQIVNHSKHILEHNNAFHQTG